MAWCGAARTGDQVSWSSWLSIYSSVTLSKSLAPKLICLPLLFKVGLTMVQKPLEAPEIQLVQNSERYYRAYTVRQAHKSLGKHSVIKHINIFAAKHMNIQNSQDKYSLTSAQIRFCHSMSLLQTYTKGHKLSELFRLPDHRNGLADLNPPPPQGKL